MNHFLELFQSNRLIDLCDPQVWEIVARVWCSAVPKLERLAVAARARNEFVVEFGHQFN
jgi:hypothetical protein